MLVQNTVHSLHGARLRSTGGLMGGGFDLARALDDAQNMKLMVHLKKGCMVNCFAAQHLPLKIYVHLDLSPAPIIWFVTLYLEE